MDFRAQRTPLLWILAIAIGAFFFLFREHREMRRENATLTSLFVELAGKRAATNDLRQLLTKQQYSHLRLDDRQPTEWSIETPTRFGARNWVLYIDVQGTEIRKLKIRTMDSEQMHPEEAPTDIVLAAH